MKGWRRLAALFLTGCMVCGCAACGGNQSGSGVTDTSVPVSDASVPENAGMPDERVADQAETSKAEGTTSKAEDTGIDFSEEPDEIVVAFAGTGTLPPDLKLVEDAVNELIKDKINVVIDLQCYTIGDFSQQLGLAISSGEQVDLTVTTPIGSSQFTTMCSQHQLEPLDELLSEYGQDIVDVVGEDLLAATRAEGHIYGVPAYNNKAQDSFFCIRTDLVDKYNLEDQVNNIKSLEDLTAIFEVLKQEEGIVAPVGGKQQILTSTFGLLYDQIDTILYYDTLGAPSIRLAGVEIDKDTTKVVNLYETDEYGQMLKVLKQWYDAGYIYKDAATYAESGPDLIKTNVTACMFSDSQLGVETSMELSTGYKMTCVKITDGMIDAGVMRKFVWGIPTVAKEPEAAMRFLNLMYKDADLVNLLTWGIEGTHYEQKEDGTIGLLEGETSQTCGYYLGGLDFLFGNCFLAKVWEGNDPQLREKAKAEMDGQKMSPVLGFSMDTSNLENEITAITNAISEYRYSLECGMSDPVSDLEAFREKLRSSGVDVYLEEIQRQLDAYLGESK